jgi:signal transduction histidine kinase
MRLPLSHLRTRLLLWHGTLSAILITGFAVSIFHLEKTRRYAEVDTQLTARLGLLADALRKERRPDRETSLNTLESVQQVAQSSFGPSSPHYFAIWLRGPHPASTSPQCPHGVERPSPLSSAPRTRGEFREISLSTAPVDVILVGTRVNGLVAELSKLARRLLLVGTLLQCVSIIPGIWLSKRTAAPIESIVHAAQQIASGNLSARIAIGPDHGELSILAEKLNRSFMQLEDLFLQQGRFTSDAAHELRTPLAIILSQTQSILRRHRTPEEYRDAITAVGRGAERMKGLLSTLLRLAKIDAHREQPIKVPTDFQAALTLHMASLSDSCGAAGVKLTSDLKRSFALVDPTHLELILSNLLNNALQHNLPNGAINLSTTNTQTHVLLVIANTSRPIPSEQLPHLFERFFQADASRTGDHAGLGLSIALELTRLNDGTLGITHERGITTVSLSLPSAPPPP